MDSQTRLARITLLREISEDIGKITGTPPYMYANRPVENGAEYFHFQGDVKVTGVDAALAHVREIARRTPGVMYR
jgi:hypothetical protein